MTLLEIVNRSHFLLSLDSQGVGSVELVVSSLYGWDPIYIPGHLLCNLALKMGLKI